MKRTSLLFLLLLNGCQTIDKTVDFIAYSIIDISVFALYIPIEVIGVSTGVIKPKDFVEGIGKFWAESQIVKLGNNVFRVKDTKQGFVVTKKVTVKNTNEFIVYEERINRRKGIGKRYVYILSENGHSRKPTKKEIETLKLHSPEFLEWLEDYRKSRRHL